MSVPVVDEMFPLPRVPLAPPAAPDGERLGTLTQEARIRLALTELGTTFIKLGQMLSTRPDVVGPERVNRDEQDVRVGTAGPDGQRRQHRLRGLLFGRGGRPRLPR